MDERERRELVEKLERRLSSFKDLCASPFECTEADLDRTYPEPLPKGASLDFKCLVDGGSYYGVLSVASEYVQRQAAREAAAGVCAQFGYPDYEEFLSLVSAGDERAVEVHDLCVRFIIRPAYLYVLLRLADKVDEAFRELSDEAAAAVFMHIYPEMLPDKINGRELPPAGEPSSWAESVRRDGYEATRDRLKPFSVPVRPKPLPDSVVARAVANFRTALEKQLGGSVDEQTFASHLTVKALAEYSGVSRSTFRRHFNDSEFKGDIEALRRSFAGE